MNARTAAGGSDELLGTAAMLRRRFDDGFASPRIVTGEAQEGLLAIRVGADSYALRLAEIAGLYSELKIVAIPSPVAQLLGIVGLRGSLAPVYDLAAVLHYPPAASRRWTVLARGAQPVGFAFEIFEAHLQVGTSSLTGMTAAAAGGSNRPYLRGTVRAAGVLRPIIHMPALVELIKDYT